MDVTWAAFTVFAAGIAEGNVAIICACAPSLKSCFRTFFQDLSNMTGSRRKTGSGNSNKSKMLEDGSIGMGSNENWQGQSVLVESSWEVESTHLDRVYAPKGSDPSISAAHT
jgi:hypothetical protein